MKILLAGGAGYIGSHTAVELLNAGYDVVIGDNFANSKPDVLDKIKEITKKEFKFYETDFTNKEQVENIFANEDIEVVVHFAGLKAVGESCSIPVSYYRNNIDSTLTILEAMKKYDVKDLVFSSSATVYGIPKQVPLKENMPTSCTNPYGWTKLMNEQILTDVSKANPDLSIVLLRYFNPIGAHESGLIGEEPNGIPANLMPYVAKVAAGKLEKLSVFGNDYNTKDGTGVRDYIHVVDLAVGHVKAIEKLNKEGKGLYIYNLGTGTGYSVLDMVKAFEKVNDIKIPYVIAPRRSGDIATCYANPEKAEKELGFVAKKTLEDMCRDAWNFEKNRK